MYESSIVQYFTERGIQQGQRQQISRLVGTVSNCADAVRLKTEPTGAKVSICF